MVRTEFWGKFYFAQNGQNGSKSAISQEKVRDQVDLLHADKHQGFLQVDTTVFGG